MKRSEDRRTGAQTHGRADAQRHRRTDDVPRVLVARAGGVATLTLSRPEKRNAMDRRMIAELGAALRTADLAADVAVVALRGAGKDFCAGLDLDELLASADLPVEENERRAMELGELLIALRKMPKVTVALVHGRALAGGCGLATACDIVLARPGAEFGYPEIRRGFVPAMVMTMLRRAVGEKLAFDLAATGRIVGADEAERLGLVSRVLPARGFEREAKKLLQEIAGFSASALALIKQQFYQLDGLGAPEGIRLGARVNALARATPGFRQAIAAFLKK
ncbi:MAG: enoyl-CoA hydratase/isomerase family protein [Gemmatimonadetes bacterium]|nr:enoyl-CoA hydratase/isomerase family protein [Gemmatimonadota bacterium]